MNSTKTATGNAKAKLQMPQIDLGVLAKATMSGLRERRAAARAETQDPERVRQCKEAVEEVKWSLRSTDGNVPEFMLEAAKAGKTKALLFEVRYLNTYAEAVRDAAMATARKLLKGQRGIEVSCKLEPSEEIKSNSDFYRIFVSWENLPQQQKKKS